MARLAPRPDVATSIRKAPQRRGTLPIRRRSSSLKACCDRRTPCHTRDRHRGQGISGRHEASPLCASDGHNGGHGESALYRSCDSLRAAPSTSDGPTPRSDSGTMPGEVATAVQRARTSDARGLWSDRSRPARYHLQMTVDADTARSPAKAAGPAPLRGAERRPGPHCRPGPELPPRARRTPQVRREDRWSRLVAGAATQRSLPYRAGAKSYTTRREFSPTPCVNHWRAIHSRRDPAGGVGARRRPVHVRRTNGTLPRTRRTRVPSPRSAGPGRRDDDRELGPSLPPSQPVAGGRRLRGTNDAGAPRTSWQQTADERRQTDRSVRLGPDRAGGFNADLAVTTAPESRT